MKKVCLVIPSLQPGGMERVMSELAHHFCNLKKYEVHLVLYGIKRDVFYNIPESIQIHKPSFEFDNEKRIWNTIKTLFFLNRKFRELKPISILSFGEYWNNFVLLSLIGLPYPIYVSDRCQPDKSLGNFHNLLRKWLYPRATGVIAQTQKAKDIYSGIFSHPNITVIGNPIRELPNDRGIFKENIILSVGRLIQTKHHDELIKLFARFDKPDWKLIIVGDDALKQQNYMRLQVLIDSLGVQERVQLAGKQVNVEEFYLRSKIFAFTSSSEGFPNVIGEAMSAGLPVVTFDCVAGPSEMIKDGDNGFLVPLFDYDLFALKLKTLMDNEDLRMRLGENARLSIQSFSSAVIGEKFAKAILAG